MGDGERIGTPEQVAALPLDEQAAAYLAAVRALTERLEHPAP